MANRIKFEGNTNRFAGQRSAILLSAELGIVKTLSPEFKEHIGENLIPRGSCIVSIYKGNLRIPFADVRNYGSASLLRMQKSIGQTFEIDVPDTEVKPVELELKNE